MSLMISSSLSLSPLATPVAVQRGEADFGLNFVGSQEGDVEFQPLMEEQFVAACRRDHPLAKKRQVRWAELAQYDYIAADKVSGNRLLLDQALAGVPGRPQAVYEAEHVTTMLGLVEAGLGVAAVPSMAIIAASIEAWSVASMPQRAGASWVLPLSTAFSPPETSSMRVSSSRRAWTTSDADRSSARVKSIAPDARRVSASMDCSACGVSRRLKSPW